MYWTYLLKFWLERMKISKALLYILYAIMAIVIIVSLVFAFIPGRS